MKISVKSSANTFIKDHEARRVEKQLENKLSAEIQMYKKNVNGIKLLTPTIDEDI